MHRVRTPEENRASAPVGGFAARSTAGLVVVALLGVVFALALTAVAARWQPLQRADEGVVDAVNTFVHDRPWLVSALHFITDLGGAWVLWLLTIMAIVYLLVRRLPRLATYVAVTGLGALVL